MRGSKLLETIKALGLRPRAFITFSVFGTPDETLALVFDILHKDLKLAVMFVTEVSLQVTSFKVIQNIDRTDFPGKFFIQSFLPRKIGKAKRDKRGSARRVDA